MAQRRNNNSNSNHGKMDEEQVPFSTTMEPVQGNLQLDGIQRPTSGNKTKNAVTATAAVHPNNKTVDSGAATTTTTDESALSVEDRYRAEQLSAKRKHWMESPFAVGMVEPTWADEVAQNPNSAMCCPAYICSKLGAGRVGNMAVLRQTTEWVEQVEIDQETGQEKKQRFTRPRLVCVFGPFWPMLLLITYPLIFGVSLWTLFHAIPGKPLLLQVVWGTLTVSLILALAFTSFRDPGILYRVQQPPPQEENQWRWNDQAQTYRPRNAFYDTDCGVVVEEFDHT